MKAITLGVVIVLTTLGAQAAELKWHTNPTEALDIAKKENKLVLLNFTGSDWCEECKNLESEVCQTTEFQEYARTNFVLVEIDSPITPPLPPELKKANEALEEKYEVRDWPTFVVLDARGKILGLEPGYRKGDGPRKVIEKLARFRSR